MGFHTCEWCEQAGILNADQPYSPHSSADVTLTFESGNSWRFPWVGLPHYISAHNYCPPKAFIDDVMSGQVVGGAFEQTKSLPQTVGYLRLPAEIPTGDIPDGFLEKLETLVNAAKNQNGNTSFRQTRSG